MELHVACQGDSWLISLVNTFLYGKQMFFTSQGSVGTMGSPGPPGAFGTQVWYRLLTYLKQYFIKFIKLLFCVVQN